MNLYFLTYFIIFIWIKEFIPKFGVNFRFIGKNGDDQAKENKIS